MHRLMIHLAASVAALVLLAAPVLAQDVDRSDPAATAQAFLTAYKAKDVVAMAPLSSATNRAMFTGLAEQGESHPAFAEVFGGWRWETAQAASGEVGTPRYKAGDRALVPFHRMESEVAVIVLANEDGLWGIVDINSPDQAQFDALPETPPQ